MTDQSIVDKTMRSVFVGNIPYEVSEEKLKDIFSEVGPVLSFKLVFDRDSGKPKGYGFCEYKDQETALSAMRNLNNYEIAGRNLRVDNACTEKSRLEMQSLMQSTQVESTYGEVVSPEKAPEAISKAVASLPPEQMYELVKQMKQCIQNNQEESRQLLLQNPQLSYALLQIMILMRVVDSTTALSLLHPTNNVPAPLSLPTSTTSTTASNVVTSSTFNSSDNHAVSPSDSKPQFWGGSSNTRLSTSLQNATSAASMSNVSAMQPPPIPPMVGGQDMDMRAPPSRFSDQDLRIPSVPSFPQVDMFKRDPRLQQLPDMQPFQGLVPPPGILASPSSLFGMIPPPNIPLPMQIPIGAGNLPAMPPNMPRMVPPPSAMSHPIRSQQNSNPAGIPNVMNPGLKAPLISAAGTDTEKANLIMQVLKLTDDQIAALPPEHRQSILTLKDQIAKSAATR